jgi:hypothetical protein
MANVKKYRQRFRGKINGGTGNMANSETPLGKFFLHFEILFASFWPIPQINSCIFKARS